jgi:hypothetical protein
VLKLRERLDSLVSTELKAELVMLDSILVIALNLEEAEKLLHIKIV